MNVDNSITLYHGPSVCTVCRRIYYVYIIYITTQMNMSCSILVEISHLSNLGPNSRGARVSFGLWILKVKGPTLNLHILNAEVVLITVWWATFWNQWESRCQWQNLRGANFGCTQFSDSYRPLVNNGRFLTIIRENSSVYSLHLVMTWSSAMCRSFC